MLFYKEIPYSADERGNEVEYGERVLLRFLSDYELMASCLIKNLVFGDKGTRKI